MIAMVRNLAGGLTGGLVAKSLTRLAAQSAARVSSRTWIVEDKTPFVTTMTPLGQRVAEIPKPGAGCETAAESPPAKPPLEVRFKLKDGRVGVVRRAVKDDLPALVSFLRRPEVTVGPPAYDAGHADQAAEEHLWMAGARHHDAVVALVDGDIVGTAHVNPQTHGMAHHKDEHFLNSHGLASGEVCVGHLTVTCGAQNQGIGTALKRATAIAATQAGYQGVTHEVSHPKVKAIVKKLGGNVQEEAVLGWTLLKGDAKGVASE